MQNNGFDCGVFACRFAQEIMRMRDKSFLCNNKFLDSRIRNPLIEEWICAPLVASCTQDSVTALRSDLAKVIAKVSELYTQNKKS